MFARNRKEESLTFRSLNGDEVRVRFDRTSVQRTAQLRTMGTPSETIGELVDFAVGACPALVAHGLLDVADPGRLVGLLHEFRSYRLNIPDRPDELAAERLGVQWIRRAAKEWLLSTFATEDRLLPLLALETACFLDAVACGAHRDLPEDCRWHLSGHLKEAPRDESLHRDKKFKKSFTEDLLSVTLLVRLGEDLKVRLPEASRTYKAGTEARFIVTRCPLSAGVDERPAFLFMRPELLAESWPYGRLVIDENGDLAGRQVLDERKLSTVEGVVPWRWVVGYLDRRPDVPTWMLAPRFEWSISS